MTEAPSLWRSLAKTVPMMLVFGIVGPAFLGFYFLLKDDPETEWLLWWGLVITVLDIALGVVISWVTYRREHKLWRLTGSGRRARADILDMEETGTRINDQ